MASNMRRSNSGLPTRNRCTSRSSSASPDSVFWIDPQGIRVYLTRVSSATRFKCAVQFVYPLGILKKSQV